MKAEKVILSNLIYNGKGREVFDGGVAISADRILAVGSRPEIEEYIGGDTVVLRSKTNWCCRVSSIRTSILRWAL